MSGFGFGVGSGLNVQGHNVSGGGAAGGYEGFGDLQLWLDDGAYEDVGGKMHSMTNQAASGLSITWTAQAGDYVLMSDVQSSGRTAFSRFAVASQWLTADVSETGFTTGATIGVVTRYVDDPVHMLTDNSSAGFNGYVGVRSGNTYSAQVSSGSDEAIGTTASASANTWHVLVFVLDTDRTLIIQDSVDVTKVAPTVWDGLTPQPFRFDFAFFAGSNSERADYLGVYAYNGIFGNSAINSLGQQMADDFGFTQTWAFAG